MSERREDIAAQILKYLSAKDYRPQEVRRVARSIGVERDDYPVFRTAVKELMKLGRIVYGVGDAIILPEAVDRIVGNFRGHQRGFGFVVPDSPTNHGDLFIPPGSTLDAITGDTVVAKITRRGKRGDSSMVEGAVIEIVERGQRRFVGQLARQERSWYVVPDGKILHSPILVDDVGASRAKAGDQVVVELTEFPSANRPGRGAIVEVLGRHGDPGIDTLSIIRQYHFHEAFPEEVLENARGVTARHNLDRALEVREDLRDEVIVTIDPADARDFDDAISVRKLSGGGYELGVHIADVSTLVTPGSPLDMEAATRANSVYFPRHVLPMLPEILSNGLCSLQEGQPRLTKSVFIRYDGKGARKEARFTNAVICSKRRLSYEEATAIIDGKTQEYPREVVDLLGRMNRLARTIQKRRLAAGMIVLDLPEVDLVLDDDGEVTDVKPTDTSFSHTIIEMFMVEANEAAAELLTRINVPHLRRIHPEPPSNAQEKLSSFLRVLRQPVPDKLEREDMRRLLASARGKPEAFAVNLAVLRSMAQAEYSPKMIGHFALASRHYCHFTSPIRRYPDLLIHRLLERYLEGQLKTRREREAVPSQKTLTEIGKKCSYIERRAEAAERELRQIKMLRLLEKRLGDVEDGVVTGVSNVGVFVQLQRYMIDGLIRFADLPDDWWNIDARRGLVLGQRSGRRITIGDRLQVQIASVDVVARELVLALANGALQSKTGGGKSKKGIVSAPKNKAVGGQPRSRKQPAQGRGNGRKSGGSGGRRR